MGLDPPTPASSRQIASRLAARIGAEIEARMASPLAPGLYLVATPIGNLADVTLRALVVMAGADRLYCEDTRQSRKLLDRYGISRRLSIYQEHNAERERPTILAALGEGRSIAIVSDAGTPLISDPGFKLARAAIEAGFAVYPIPGASAVLAALAAAGLPTDAFHFAGFLPSRTSARRARIAELAAVPGTLVMFESAARLGPALADLAGGLGERDAVVARELTKLNENCRRDRLSALAAWAAGAEVKGEIVLVVGPGRAREIGDEEIVAALGRELATQSLRDAVATVADDLGIARNRAYDLALGLKQGRKERDDG